uniref:G_PROTEIN_RECEP_F1_2 domain-containing protein n=1 Tax=Panagrellus redivivus TaxID=6233 RepID=A0A7E4V888_PANRE
MEHKEVLFPIGIVFILALIGVLGNLFVAMAAWSLRTTSTCNYLIFAGTVMNVVHQSIHFVTTFVAFTGISTIPLDVCFIMQVLPFSCIIGTSVITLFIGIDRVIGFYFPFVYHKFSIPMYVAVVYVLTGGYALTFIILFFSTIEDMSKPVLCAPGSIITIDYAFYYLFTTAALYIVTTVLYMSIWFISYKHRKELPGYTKILKPITIIVALSLSGWLLNFLFSIIATSIDLNPEVAPLWGGITVNLAVASEFFVFYAHSTEYRKFFVKQMLKCVKKSSNSKTGITLY